MRIVFMGTPEFAVPTLSEIVAGGHEVVAVYTRAPRPAGRGQAERKSPVHVSAEGFGIPVFTPKTLRDADAQGHGRLFTNTRRTFGRGSRTAAWLTWGGRRLVTRSCH